MKGHHIYRSHFTIGAIFGCELESANIHSSWAIVVMKSTGETVGHVPDNLAEVLTPLLESGEVQAIKCEVTGLSKAADEGVWVQGGGVVIPCTYILLGKKVNKPVVRIKLKEKARKKRKRSEDDLEPEAQQKRKA